MSSNSTYTKLPGARGLVTRRHTLWAGPDHLLKVRRTVFRETYRRFYYRDIQALSLQVRADAALGLLDGIVVMVTAALILSIRPLSHLGWTTFLLLVLTTFLTIRLTKPRCLAFVQTALGTETLPSLWHRSTAIKTFATIQARISDAQSDLAQPGASEPVLAPPDELLPVSPQPLPLDSTFDLAPQISAPTPPLPLRPDKVELPAFYYLLGPLLLLVVGGIRVVYPPQSPAVENWIFPTTYFLCALALSLPMFKMAVAGLSARERGAVLTSALLTAILGTYRMAIAVQLLTPAGQQSSLNNIYEDLGRSPFFGTIAGILLIVIAVAHLVLLHQRWLPSNRPRESVS